MNARIEKKLSKKLVFAAPKLFKDYWIDTDISDAAHKQGSRVSHIPSVGGGVDRWGEGEDAYTAYCWILMSYEWIGNFPKYPEGHEFERHPDISGFKPTAKNLLRLAASVGA